ncbi:DUF6265 family protein [Qipengyuania seohaensis]|uniref:DUF6265 family protein n=1 Tax=Qipengyuania seohaensis TaxID=266951 RepID=UPI001E603BCF|nr:DUF6265 family protein [Qipengyuania seohaensis]
MRGWTMIAGALALLASPVAAQETRVAPEDHAPPPATLEKMDWLVGQWIGTGIGGAPAMESWLPPSGGTMIGSFVQETDEGAIRFTEHLYLMEEEGTLVLRLKHFNADLTGWEEKDGMLTFRLIAVEDCAAYFHGLTLRCDGEQGLLAAVRMKSAGEKLSELVFRFRRAGDTAIPDCAKYETTSYSTCFALALDQEQGTRQELADAYRTELADGRAATSAFDKSEQAFDAYLLAECGEGADAESLLCQYQLTRDRNRSLRANWLVP